MKISKLHLQLRVTKEYEKNFENLKGAMASSENIVKRLNLGIL